MKNHNRITLKRNTFSNKSMINRFKKTFDSTSISCFEAVCWDYNINAKDVYSILKTKNDKDYPISFDVLRKKVLKYIPVQKIQNVFSKNELKDVFSGINPNTIRNPETKSFYIREIA